MRPARTRPPGLFAQSEPAESAATSRHRQKTPANEEDGVPSAGVICRALCFSHLNMGSSSGDINNRIDLARPATRVIDPFSSSFRIIW